ncbi:MAG: YibE/F family protein [Dysosmobacter sp.]|uniref:YibE/F family protein n=1 Tax=Dysosmobacter sp. TaxID=2591382 RepID=UPI00284D18AE|nr:YibE/F family protein [Dysosmobacter sp.]MDR3981971.1 YibE/F family protein [Dysosmobacter sp.]
MVWKRWAPPLVLLALFLLLVVRLNQVDKVALVSREGQTFEKGVVTEILQDNVQPDGSRVGEQVVRVLMKTGELKGREIETTSSSGFLFGAPCTVGMKVVVMQSLAGDTVVSSVYAQDREFQILAFAALYLLALCLIGGWQGAKGALGLVFTFGCILWVYLPLVYRGWSPFWSAVLVCAVTAVVTLWLVGGPTRKTLVAAAGTVAGVVMAGVAASLFSLATGITGWNVSDIESLMTLWSTADIQVGGLLFSGLLISSLGATMDVAMSIASSMAEVQAQTPDISRRALFQAGMRVGRDMMGTDSNTLILAFAGGSVSMLVLDYAYDLPWLQIINSNNIGIAVMQGLAGSFGVVLSVPVTVALAMLLYVRPDRETPALLEQEQA